MQGFGAVFGGSSQQTRHLLHVQQELVQRQVTELLHVPHQVLNNTQAEEGGGYIIKYTSAKKAITQTVGSRGHVIKYPPLHQQATMQTEAGDIYVKIYVPSPTSQYIDGGGGDTS